ncbi:winged helix-turn-helix transcriptional regulator [Pectobacterium versatile]|uniref:winged helix-turn-helix transcriptional regulator n=1 Tax=Pectobacterium versatile TaxID=2488639 RepID=UPI003800C25C
MTTKQRLMRYLRRHEGLTRQELARSLNITSKEAGSAINTLREDGDIIALGTPGKYKYYSIGVFQPAFGVHPAQARFTQLLAGVRA